MRFAEKLVLRAPASLYRWFLVFVQPGAELVADVEERAEGEQAGGNGREPLYLYAPPKTSSRAFFPSVEKNFRTGQQPILRSSEIRITLSGMRQT